MGFKRTTEGRVFFTGAKPDLKEMDERQDNQMSYAEKEEQEIEREGQPSDVNAHIQKQTLMLLKSLNEKLLDMQSERVKMRKQMEIQKTALTTLEDKIEENEKAYLNVHEQIKNQKPEAKVTEDDPVIRETLKEIEATKKILAAIEERAEKNDEKISGLQRVQTDQLSKLTKSTETVSLLAKRMKETETSQLEMSERFEQALADQAKLARKLDQTLEERARFMRKIERIEEAVTQTRDALNAKAMVLLTNKDAAGMIGANEDLTLGEALLRSEQPKEDRPVFADAPLPPSFFEKPLLNNLPLQTAIAASVLAIGVFFCWYVNDLRYTNADPVQTVQQSAAQLSAIEPASDKLQTPEPEARQTASAQPSGKLDLSALQNQRQAEQMLESNPDEIASMLNAIEPGNPEGAQAYRQPEEKAQTSGETLSQAQQSETAQQTPLRDDERSAAPPEKTSEEPVRQAETSIAERRSYNPDPQLPEAIRNVEEQAYAGSAEAQHDLAAIYTAGYGGVEQDYQRAAYWFAKAAEQDVANAKYNLGVLFHQGLGVEADIRKAITWYESAAEQGHPEAQYNLGIAFIEGIGVPYNAQQAAYYFEQAATSGVTEAAYNLGLIYENGLLGAAKPDQALRWYKKASDEGSPEATAALEQLADTLDIRLEDVNRLVESMTRSEENQTRLSEAESLSRTEPASGAINNEAMVSQIQQYLMNEGLYPGPADGRVGPLTTDAIRAYQSRNGMDVTGEPSGNLLRHMASADESNGYGSRE